MYLNVILPVSLPVILVAVFQKASTPKRIKYFGWQTWRKQTICNT